MQCKGNLHCLGIGLTHPTILGVSDAAEYRLGFLPKKADTYLPSGWPLSAWALVWLSRKYHSSLVSSWFSGVLAQCFSCYPLESARMRSLEKSPISVLCWKGNNKWGPNPALLPKDTTLIGREIDTIRAKGAERLFLRERSSGRDRRPFSLPAPKQPWLISNGKPRGEEYDFGLCSVDPKRRVCVFSLLGGPYQKAKHAPLGVSTLLGQDVVSPSKVKDPQLWHPKPSFFFF